MKLHRSCDAQWSAKDWRLRAFQVQGGWHWLHWTKLDWRSATDVKVQERADSDVRNTVSGGLNWEIWDGSYSIAKL